MSLSRRDFALLTAASLLAPSLAPVAARAEPAVPMIVAEGGAVEERIEDTKPAFDLAITQGCDFLQVNVVPSKEGALVARRDNELSDSTDVATHAEFADRRITKTIDGKTVSGWFTEDFTLAELRTLACRERLSTLRPQNAKWSGQEGMLTLGEVLQAARDGCVRTGRTIGVCPRLIHYRHFVGQQLAVDELLAAELTTQGYVAPAAAIWAQASDPDALKSLARLTRVRRMQVIGTSDTAMTTSRGLADIRTYADAIAPDQDLILDPAGAFPGLTTLILDAHSAGLQVFSRTARVENAFLPPALRKGDKRSAGYDAGHGDVDRLMVTLFANGVDGLATDVPGAAQKARGEAIDLLNQARSNSRR